MTMELLTTPMHGQSHLVLLLAAALIGTGCQTSALDPTIAPTAISAVVEGSGTTAPTSTTAPEEGAEPATTKPVDVEADPELVRSFVFSPPPSFELEVSERNVFGVGYYEYLAADLPARIFFATGLAEFEYEGFPDKPWITGEEDWRVAAPPRDVTLGNGIDVEVYRYRRVMSGRTEFVQWVFGFDGQDGIVRGAILSTSTVFTDADVRAVLAEIR